MKLIKHHMLVGHDKKLKFDNPMRVSVFSYVIFFSFLSAIAAYLSIHYETKNSCQYYINNRSLASLYTCYISYKL